MFKYAFVCSCYWLLLGTASIQAQEYDFERGEKKLSILVKKIELPRELFLKEVKSGLPNIINMSLKLEQGGIVRSDNTVELVITYDLWDEHFYVNYIQRGMISQAIYYNEDTLFNAITNIRFESVVSEKISNTKKSANLIFRTIFNPVNMEKVKRIQAWIKSSNGFDISTSDKISTNPTPKIGSITIKSKPKITNGNKPSINFVENSSGPRFKKLFDKILEENMSGDLIAAQWKSKVTTTNIPITSLINEQQKD